MRDGFHALQRKPGVAAVPLLTGSDITQVSARLSDRDVLLHHACQLSDLESYLLIGGVPSRSTLRNRGLRFTGFESDSLDQTNGVWDKVFFNLRDLGDPFASGRSWTPAVYGPISLVMSTFAMDSAIDVAVCRRSASATDFDRAGEALGPADIEGLFLESVEVGFPFASYFKQSSDGRQVEVSCTFPNGVASFDWLLTVRVDRCSVGGRPLERAVAELLAAHGLSVQPQGRSYKASRATLADEMFDLASRAKTVEALRAEASPDLRAFIESLSLEGHGKIRTLQNWLTYLREGTYQLSG